MAIEAADVVAQFGAHYIDQGQNLSNVKKLLYTPSKTAALFTDRPQTGDYFRSTNARMSSVLQPFQKKFTSKGNLTFKPNAFELFQIKIDQSVFPDDITSSYLGFMADVADNDRANFPLIKYMIEEHIIAAKHNDMETAVSFGGKYVAPVDNVASPAADSMNGIKEVLKGYAARINMGNGPIEMGAIAAADEDFCTQVEEFVADMDPVLRAQLDKVILSDTLARKYARGKRKKYGLQTAFLSGIAAKDLYTIEDYSSIVVEGYLSHEGSTVIWATPKVNRIRPIWKGVLQNVFKVESAKREVSIYTDWWEALNFEVPELIVTNDSADLA